MTRRVVLVAPDERVDVTVKGGGEQPGLPARNGYVQRALDLGPKPMSAIRIGLIIDRDRAHIAQVGGVAALHKVCEPARAATAMSTPLRSMRWSGLMLVPL